jgi:hypothetical protein
MLHTDKKAIVADARLPRNNVKRLGVDEWYKWFQKNKDKIRARNEKHAHKWAARRDIADMADAGASHRGEDRDEGMEGDDEH